MLSLAGLKLGTMHWPTHSIETLGPYNISYGATLSNLQTNVVQANLIHVVPIYSKSKVAASRATNLDISASEYF